MEQNSNLWTTIDVEVGPHIWAPLVNEVDAAEREFSFYFFTYMA